MTVTKNNLLGNLGGVFNFEPKFQPTKITAFIGFLNFFYISVEARGWIPVMVNLTVSST